MHLFRAKDRNRTYDRLITNQLLYQLSYFGTSTPNLDEFFGIVKDNALKF